MISVQVCSNHPSSLRLFGNRIGQDMFVIPDGAAGALAELERRKFTAEEGVSAIFYGS